MHCPAANGDSGKLNKLLAGAALAQKIIGIFEQKLPAFSIFASLLNPDLETCFEKY